MNSWKWDVVMYTGCIAGAFAGWYAAIALWQFVMVPVLGALS